MSQDVVVPFDNDVAKRGMDFIVSCDLCDLRIAAALKDYGTKFQLVGTCKSCGMTTRYELTTEQADALFGMMGPLRVRIGNRA